MLSLKCKLVGLWLLFVCSRLLAFPMEMSYSGRLTASDGKPLEGPVTLQIKFYRSETATTSIDLQTATANVDTDTDSLIFTNVPLSYGVFSIAIKIAAADMHQVFNGVEDVFIEVTDLTPQSPLTYPRQKYTMLPFAFKIPVDGTSLIYNDEGKLTVADWSLLNTTINQNTSDL